MNTTTALEIKPSKQVIFVDMSDPFHATVIFMITEALSKQTIKKTQTITAKSPTKKNP